MGVAREGGAAAGDREHAEEGLGAVDDPHQALGGDLEPRGGGRAGGEATALGEETPPVGAALVVEQEGPEGGGEGGVVDEVGVGEGGGGRGGVGRGGEEGVEDGVHLGGGGGDGEGDGGPRGLSVLGEELADKVGDLGFQRRGHGGGGRGRRVEMRGNNVVALVLKDF